MGTIIKYALSMLVWPDESKHGGTGSINIYIYTRIYIYTHVDLYAQVHMYIYIYPRILK